MINQKEIELVEIKKENRAFHDIEAKFFEAEHPEGSSLYEKSQVLKNFSQIMNCSRDHNLCVDMGCGTGFLTGFELSRYREVVAGDISAGMIKVTKGRFENYHNLHLLICDAEEIPLRYEITDLVSVGSVLHHLPRPFYAILEMTRILKQGGILYIIREPNDRHFRLFYDLLDLVIMKFIPRKKVTPLQIESFDRGKVDVHYLNGFKIQELVNFCLSNGCELVSAYSYHWFFPISRPELIAKLFSKINFLLENIPLSRRFGRYLCIMMKKVTPEEIEES